MINQIHDADCLEFMSSVPDGSVDLVLCDLPYAMTARLDWDQIIPMEPLWAHYRRLVKPNGVVVLTGQGLFSARLMLAAEDLYKYTLIWRKNKPRGHLNAKIQPLRVHEDVLVFYGQQPTYNPQMTSGHDPVHSFTSQKQSYCYGESKPRTGGGSTERYPVSVLDFPVINNEDPEKTHPTQKPVELGRWLVRTFTNKGDTVLDNCCGSGTFCLAACLEDRRFIGIDNGTDKKTGKRWADIARDRIRRYQEPFNYSD